MKNAINGNKMRQETVPGATWTRPVCWEICCRPYGKHILTPSVYPSGTSTNTRFVLGEGLIAAQNR